MGTFRAAVADKRGDLGIGVIGCRYQGSVIAGLAKSHGRLLAMADVDASVRDLSAIDPSVEKQTGLSPESIYEGVDRHEDYQRLLDDHRIHVILIGTPDHWHAGMLIDALKAGKDVYVDGKHRVKDITFRDYLVETNLIYGPEIEDVINIAVVWEVIEEDQYVKQIYNHDTGEIYFDESEEMTDEVDDLISSILMYGSLEQTIDGAYS